jgi:hypothetical protein
LFVAGAGWSETFRNFLGASGAARPPSATPSAPADHADELPWTNVNRVSVRFSEPVNVAADDLVVRGVRTPAHAPAAAGAFAYDAATSTATWTLAAPVAADKLLLDLDADPGTGVTDAAGNRLDGEWANPTTPAVGGADAFPSGNGTPAATSASASTSCPATRTATARSSATTSRS